MMPPNVQSNNGDLEKALEELPEKVSEALKKWRIATLDREQRDALIYIGEKGKDQKKTADEIKSIIRADEKRYEYALDEIKAEANYNFLYERLMSAKRLASLRTAY